LCFIAIENNLKEIVKLLLAYNANVNLKSKAEDFQGVTNEELSPLMMGIY
jgi:hypothetical protein